MKTMITKTMMTVKKKMMMMMHVVSIRIAAA